MKKFILSALFGLFFSIVFGTTNTFAAESNISDSRVIYGVILYLGTNQNDTGTEYSPYDYSISHKAYGYKLAASIKQGVNITPDTTYFLYATAEQAEKIKSFKKNDFLIIQAKTKDNRTLFLQNVQRVKKNPYVTFGEYTNKELTTILDSYSGGVSIILGRNSGLFLNPQETKEYINNALKNWKCVLNQSNETKWHRSSLNFYDDEHGLDQKSCSKIVASFYEGQEGNSELTIYLSSYIENIKPSTNRKIYYRDDSSVNLFKNGDNDFLSVDSDNNVIEGGDNSLIQGKFPGTNGDIIETIRSDDKTSITNFVSDNKTLFLFKDGKQIFKTPYSRTAPSVFGFSYLYQNQYIFYQRQNGKFSVIKDGKTIGSDYTTTSNIIISNDKKRFAYTVQKSGKQFAVIDGKEGKKYDWVGTPTFSDNSNSHLYLAKNGGKYFIVKNGVEGKKYDNIKYLDWKFDDPKFLSDSESIVFISLDKNKKESIVIDDKEGEKFDGVSSIISSQFGKSVSYIGRKDGKLYVVKNGIKSKGYKDILHQCYDRGECDYSISYSPDGKSLSFVASNQTDKWFVVKDGIEMTEYYKISDFSYLKDNSLIFVGGDKKLNYCAYKNGEKMECFEGINDYDSWKKGKYGINHGKFIISPDGMNYAYIVHNYLSGESGEYVVVNGIKGEVYRSGITEFKFSPDSKSYAYIGRGNVITVVKNGKNIESIGSNGNTIKNLNFLGTGTVVYGVQTSEQSMYIKNNTPVSGSLLSPSKKVKIQKK